MLISIIVPAYNEAERIVPSLEQIFEYLQRAEYDSELIVVDDGSSDATIAVSTETLARLAPRSNKVLTRVIPLGKNSGKGAAVGRGMLEANGDIRIFTDADLSTPIKEVEKVIPFIQSGQYDIVIGSRAAERRALVKKHQPFYREMMGRFFNVLVQTFVFRGFKDTQCGFKGFSGRAADYLFSRQKVFGFSFDVEILYLAERAGFKIKEVAIEWYNDERSKVGAMTDSMKMISELFRVKRIHRDDG